MFRIAFTYLVEHDAVLARFEDVELTDPADVARWERDVSQKLEGFGRKVYLLIDLAGLVVRPAAAREFGRRRADVLAKHSLGSYRFNGDRATVTTVYTSSVLDHAAANHFATFDEAVNAMRRDRGMPPASSRGAPSQR